jgi:CysZ protein
MDALRGIVLVLRSPRLWPYALGPLLGVITVYIVLGIGGGILLLPRLAEWLGRLPGGGFWTIFGEAAAVILYVLLFPFVFILLGGIFFGFVFEPLSLAVERLVAEPGETVPSVRLGFAPLFGDTVRRLFVNAGLGLTAFVVGLFLGPFAPVPGVLAASVIGILDYPSPAYLRRGHTLRPQARRLFRPLDRDTALFGLIAGLLTLVPILGVLLMPGLIAGGTLLARRREV